MTFEGAAKFTPSADSSRRLVCRLSGESIQRAYGFWNTNDALATDLLFANALLYAQKILSV